ncbi:hypothetical protein CYMTET_47217 [Cymbomonas tetramitiformis]|uniref:RING-type domain-containing protein n=1 Tax=Cymbomonas tetramitiformis TaxID=36881 RepID=A0AAE0BWC5_9CHLO|nr:hypothetical protein CYMTET_47217 [Cymbomonas tetramitiformis]
MFPAAHQTSEQFMRRIDTGHMCVMQLHPGTVVYISERVKKCGEFIFVKPSTLGWYDVYSKEQGFVMRKLLDNLSVEENLRLVSTMKQTRFTEKQLRALPTNSYEIRLPSDVAGERDILCTMTILHGTGIVYGGRNIAFADRPFVQSSHGVNLEEFCMNVTYFSCVFGTFEPISWLCEIVDSNGNEGGFAWMRNVGAVTNHFYRGYNFLHHVGLAFWEPRLLPAILELFRRSLPEALRSDRGEVARVYEKWLAVTTADGETPLSAAVIGANELAVAEFLKFAPTLHPVVECGAVAARYWNPKSSKKTSVTSIRSHERTMEAVRKVRLLLQEAIRAAIDRSERVANELLSQEPTASRKKRRPAKKKSANGWPSAIASAVESPSAFPTELGESALVEERKAPAESFPRATSRSPSLISSSAATSAHDDGSPSRSSCGSAPERVENDGTPSSRATGHALQDDGLDMLSDNRLCIICCDKPFSVALVPCGHVCLCRDCSTCGQLDRCPICRATVDSVLNLYCG